MRRALILFTVWALAVGACSGDDDDDTASAPDLTEDDAGNDDAGELELPLSTSRTVMSADGNAMVVLPEDDPTDVTVDVLDPADYPDFLAGAQTSEGTAIYDLGPDGATFDTPVRFFRRVEIANVGLDLDPLDVPLLLTYTTDDDGQPVLADDLSILRTGDSVWVGASFDHFSPAITTNSQRELDTNEVFGQLIRSIKVKKSEPPVGDDSLAIDVPESPAAPPARGAPTIELYGGATDPVLFGLTLDTPLPSMGELDATVRDGDGRFPVPASDITMIDARTADGETTNSAELRASAIGTLSSTFEGVEYGVPVATAAQTRLTFDKLGGPFGAPISTTIDVGVAFTDPATHMRASDLLLGSVPDDAPLDQAEIDEIVESARFASPVDAMVSVEHGTSDSGLPTLFSFPPSEGPGVPFDELFLATLAGDPSGGPVPVTDFAPLFPDPEGARAAPRIDRYGNWKLALVHAPDGLDDSMPLEIFSEDGTDFLSVDGERTELPTAVFRTSTGGPYADLTVDASEGVILDTPLFADGFESGDVTRWSSP